MNLKNVETEIVCVIQARMGSSRLPKKVMSKVVENIFLIDSVLNQLKFCKSFKKIIVVTTTLSEDDVLFEHVIACNIQCYRGSSEDVLDRYYQCAKKYRLKNIIRITSDNPLIDPHIVDKVVQRFFDKKCDYATNTMPRTYPYGTEVEVFSFETLEKTWKNALKPSEREHVTPYMRETAHNFSKFNLKNHEDLTHLRYTVDRLEDMKVVQEILKNISSRPILLEDILNLYKTNPQIFEINKNVKHDGYQSSLKKDEQYLKSKKKA